MTWLGLMVALLLEQMSFAGLRARADMLIRAWPRWLLGQAATPRWRGLPQAVWPAVAVLVPASLAAWAQHLLGGFFGWFWLVLVLFACLGFSSYLRTAAVLREAVEWRDQQVIAQVMGVQAPQARAIQGGWAAQALGASVVLAQRQLLGLLGALVLGWLLDAPLFVVVAFVAAQAWSRAQLGADASESEQAFGTSTQGLIDALDAGAAWLTTLALGAVGGFDAVLQAARESRSAWWREGTTLLLDAAGAALKLPEDWCEISRLPDDEAGVTLEHMLRWERLVWRVLGFWVLVFAVFTALAA